MGIIVGTKRKLTLLVAMALFAAACGSGVDEGSGGNAVPVAPVAPAPAETPVPIVEIAYASHVMDITDTYGQMLEGFKEALDGYFGANYRLTEGVAQGSADLEGLDRIFSDLVTVKPDYAVLGMPAYGIFEPKLLEIQAAGTKVIVPEYAPQFLTEVNLKPLTWVTYSHADMGIKGGEFIGDDRCATGKDFKVVIFHGLAASEIGAARANGFIEALDKKVASCGLKYEIIDEVYTDFDREKAFRAAETMALAHPVIDVAVGMNSNTALGMMGGFAAGNRLGGIDIVGMGGQLDEAAAICRGDIRVAAVRNARDMGALAAQAIWLDSQGRTAEIPEVSLIGLNTAHDCETVFSGMPMAMLSQPMFKDNLLPGQWDTLSKK